MKVDIGNLHGVHDVSDSCYRMSLSEPTCLQTKCRDVKVRPYGWSLWLADLSRSFNHSSIPVQVSCFLSKVTGEIFVTDRRKFHFHKVLFMSVFRIVYMQCPFRWYNYPPQSENLNCNRHPRNYTLKQAERKRRIGSFGQTGMTRKQ